MREDLYTNVTARIIAALEQGVAPWVRPWSVGIDTLPINAGTKRAYRGINVMLLALEAQTAGYPLNRWLTYRQTMELGGQVRKGARGTTVVFWKLRKVDATADANPDGNEPDLHERVLRAQVRCFGRCSPRSWLPAAPCADQSAATSLRTGRRVPLVGAFGASRQ